MNIYKKSARILVIILSFLSKEMNKITILGIVFFVNMQISLSHGPPTGFFDTPSSTAATLITLGSMMSSVFFAKKSEKQHEKNKQVSQPIIKNKELLESYIARSELRENPETGNFDYYFNGTDEEINEANRLLGKVCDSSKTLEGINEEIKKTDFYGTLSGFSVFISFSSCLYLVFFRKMHYFMNIKE